MAGMFDFDQAQPIFGVQVSAPNYSKLAIYAPEYEILAKWNSACGAGTNKSVPPWEFVREATPASINEEGCYQLSEPLWICVFKSDWLGVSADPCRPAAFLVRAWTQGNAHLKAQRALLHGHSDEGVFPLCARTYQHLFSQGFFYEDMPVQTRQQLLNHPQHRFSVSNLSRTPHLSYARGNRQSFVHRQLSEDPRLRLYPGYLQHTLDSITAHTIRAPEPAGGVAAAEAGGGGQLPLGAEAGTEEAAQPHRPDDELYEDDEGTEILEESEEGPNMDEFPPLKSEPFSAAPPPASTPPPPQE